MIITLLTDFGTRDPYVGILKGVIKGIAPQADIVDLTHEIPPQDVAAGAFALKTAVHYFPAGTIHVAVVDPGVGSARRAIAARIGDSVYLCPDNGILSYVMAEHDVQNVVVLNHTQYHRPSVSRTFHGRDIFAPVAAHLALGVPLDSIGTPTGSWVRLPIPHPDITDGAAVCHVVAADVFGNIVTDMTEDLYDAWNVAGCQIAIGSEHVPGPAASYSEVPPGAPVALFSSGGHLEISVRNGSAMARYGLHRGDLIHLKKNG